MAYVLGIDVGTTRVKVVVVNEQGDVVSSGSADSRVMFGPGERAEQDPEELWASVVWAVRKATKDIGDRIRGASLSTQGGTLIVMDGDGTPLLPAITWMDRRARPEGEEMSRRYGLLHFYERCGWTPEGGSLPLSQVAWVRAHERLLFEGAVQFGFVDSFLIQRMTGRHVTDPSNAAITVLCDVRQRTWDKELLAMVGISEEQLPEIVPSGEVVGRVLSDVAEVFGISRETVVYAGGHDQYCGALGAGVIEPGDTMLSTGTAWVLLTATEEPLFDVSSRFAPAPHVIEGRWGLLASIPTAGVCMEWLIRQTFGTDERQRVFEVINELVQKTAPGSEGLVFLPHFSGSSWPTWKQNARGAFVGLTLTHGRGHLFRAVMEGVMFQVRWVLDTMRTAGAEPTALRMVGGGARSPIWPGMVADGTGVPVVVPETTETANFGAALLAGLGMGLFETDDLEMVLDREARRIEPDPMRKGIYDEMFEVYRRAFGGLEWAFDRLARCSSCR